MKITRLHIAGFGCLRDVRFSFEDGLNTICRENGFGKSTLIGFIKAMLYGFSDTKKMSLAENDRKKYLPWDGGVCGGTLWLEAKDSLFRIERTFGDKPSADTMSVYDEGSGLLINSLGKIPGHTLLGIDADGFLHTLCLSERIFKGGVKNESISDLLSRTVASGGAMTGAEEAIALLQKQQKQLQKRGGRGEIAALSEQISRHRARLVTLEESALRAKALDGELMEQRTLLKEKEGELSTLCDGDAPLSEEALARERRERELRLKKVNERLLRIDERLGNRALDTEEVDRMQRLEVQLEAIEKGALNEKRLRKLFEGKLTRQELDLQIDIYKSMHKEGKEEEIQAFWRMHPELVGNAVPTLDEIKIYHKRKKLLSFLPLWISVFFIGILLFLAATSISPLLFPIGALMLLFPTIFLLLFPLPKQKRGTRARVSRTLAMLRGIPRGELYSLFAERERILQLEKQKEEYEHQERELREFLSRFDIEESELSRAMDTLCSLYSSYEHMQSDPYRRDLEEQRALYEELERFRHRFRAIGPSPYGILREMLFERNALLHEREELIRAADISTKENDDAKAMLLSRISALRTEIRDLEISIARGEEELSHLEAGLEEIEAERASLAELCARRLEYEKRLEVLAKTEEYLRRAKKGMESGYLSATRESLHRVLDTLGEIDAERIHLNQSLEIMREEQGLCRPIDALSRGECDLYQLAIRLALIDTLYGAEDRPPILLDDPFLTFDDARLEHALFYLRALGRNTQILYFTCASART